MANRFSSNIISKDTVKGGGGGGSTSYNELSDKPSINGHELEGYMSSEDLGIAADIRLTEVENESQTNGNLTRIAVEKINPDYDPRTLVSLEGVDDNEDDFFIDLDIMENPQNPSSGDLLTFVNGRPNWANHALFTQHLQYDKYVHGIFEPFTYEWNGTSFVKHAEYGPDKGFMTSHGFVTLSQIAEPLSVESSSAYRWAQGTLAILECSLNILTSDHIDTDPDNPSNVIKRHLAVPFTLFVTRQNNDITTNFVPKAWVQDNELIEETFTAGDEAAVTRTSFCRMYIKDAYPVHDEYGDGTDALYTVGSSARRICDTLGGIPVTFGVEVLPDANDDSELVIKIYGDFPISEANVGDSSNPELKQVPQIVFDAVVYNDGKYHYP